jgi:hypothetical protein
MVVLLQMFREEDERSTEKNENCEVSQPDKTT